jgi:MFS family permease
MRKPRLASPPPPTDAPIFLRRAARDAFCRNAFLWGVGISFVNSTFVIYFLTALVPNASDSAALGTAIAWTVAAPRLIGLLRLLTPAAIAWVGGRKRLCVSCALLAPTLLLALPFGAPFFERLAASRAGGLNVAFFLIGAIWAIHHLAEYVSTTALWSWMGDVVTPASRLRFFARRERRLLLGKIVGLLGVGVFTYLQRSPRFASELLAADAWRVALPSLGVVFLIASVFPLFRAPEICVERSPNAKIFNILRETLAPLRAPSFLTLVLFGVALQAVLGFTQAPQYYFRTSAFELSLFASLTTTAIVNVGQWSSTSYAARFVARWQAPTACFLALSVVAFGFLAYAFAPTNAWILAFVAALFWIAWVVVNIALNNEITKRSEPSRRSAFVAFYFTSTALAFGLSSMLGGWNFDRVRAFSAETPTSDLEIVYCRCVFLIAAALLALAPATLLLFRGAANPNKNND